MDKKFFICIGILIIFTAALVFLLTESKRGGTQTVLRTNNKCGDNICEVSEDCNSCSKDCGCSANEYCSNNGICRVDICGDGKCENSEKENCCQDCGCNGDQLCNKYTEKCINSIPLDKNGINKTVDEYLERNKMAATVLYIEDSYFKDNAIKEVFLNCSTSSIPCAVTLILNENLEIIGEYKTI